MKPKKIIKEIEKICKANKCTSCPFGIYYEWYNGYNLECLFNVPVNPTRFREKVKRSKEYINQRGE